MKEKPKLILLTGPVADEVAEVFQKGIIASENRRDDIRGTVNTLISWWDEVRDYWAAPKSIARCNTVDCPESCWQVTAERICAIPGGEAWLVEQVLPQCWPWDDSRWRTAWAYHHRTMEGAELPRRLAILAPKPPPLLVERVLAWGGERWECYDDSERKYIDTAKFEGLTVRSNWPEAVQSALEK